MPSTLGAITVQVQAPRRTDVLTSPSMIGSIEIVDPRHNGVTALGGHWPMT